MDLIDRIKELSSRVPDQVEHIKTEEATKNAFIMPFISALGYDVFNPVEVIPEFTADFGAKKGEKVDYAIKKDADIIMLIECKWVGADLHQDHASQLCRYFSATKARFAILTNGIKYSFYSDIDEHNKMDSKPFFEFDILDFEDHHISELKKFTKSSFSLDNILNTASTLKYTREIKKILQDELKNPSESFVRFFASQIYDGRLTQRVIEQFTQIVKEARTQFINERISERLKSALSASSPEQETIDAGEELGLKNDSSDGKNETVTTQEENGYNVVKTILQGVVDVKRLSMRHTKKHCGILLDNTNRKPICRFYFNQSKKELGLMRYQNEERVEIDGVDDIFAHAERIKSVILEYEGQ